jgi:hypothetical protein
MLDRLLLMQYFKLTGGRYVPAPNAIAVQGGGGSTTNPSLIGSGSYSNDSPLIAADAELKSFITSLP